VHQEENRLRIATYWWGGRRHVGRLSGDGKAVVPLALGERAHAVGALALIEALAGGDRLLQPAGASLPLAAIRLDAPIPVPRRNISTGLTLYPGDIIATGTPSGVGMGFDPPRYLRRGDVVRIEIDGIGVLENPVH
jgi:hypothetical protein